MKYPILPLIALLSFSPVFATPVAVQTGPWTSANGCYQTLSINGKSVRSTTAGYIKNHPKDIWVIDATTNTVRQLPIVDVQFGLADGGTYTSQGGSLIFTGEDNLGLHFAFHGRPLEFPNSVLVLHVEMDLISLGQNLYQVHYRRQVENHPEHESDLVFKLLKVSCRL